MLKNESRELGKMQSTDVKAGKKVKVTDAYSTPQLIAVGRTLDLVQGCVGLTTQDGLTPRYRYDFTCGC